MEKHHNEFKNATDVNLFKGMEYPMDDCRHAPFHSFVYNLQSAVWFRFRATAVACEGARNP